MNNPTVAVPNTGEVIATFARAIFHGSHNLENIPGLLKRIIREDLWQEYPQGGEIVRFNRFQDFLVKGVDVQPQTLKNLCRDDPEALDLLDQVLTHQGYRSDLHDNVMEVKVEQGNTEAYALRRLRKARPDLHEKVINGKLSLNAAMVEAGFRPKTITIPRDPNRVASLLRKHFNGDEIKTILKALSDS
jgi:hypothetical protein